MSFQEFFGLQLRYSEGITHIFKLMHKIYSQEAVVPQAFDTGYILPGSNDYMQQTLFSSGIYTEIA
jgi:hypothetical protein